MNENTLFYTENRIKVLNLKYREKVGQRAALSLTAISSRQLLCLLYIGGVKNNIKIQRFIYNNKKHCKKLLITTYTSAKIFSCRAL